MVPRAAVFSLVAFATHCLAAPQVIIGKTTVTGRELTGSKVDFFGGIPYAEPPVGKLRFRGPVVKSRLDSPTFEATSFGKSCLQPPTFNLGEVSEDCLTINIHRPAGTKPGARLPILFWVYGGGFIVGGSNQYNGSVLVSRSVERGTPIMYVSLNYRLGPFGYPQGQEAQNRGGLNLALKDIRAALEWLHLNVHAFGGDRRKITIFGESAGARAIGLLYLDRKIERLIRGAILESGSATSAASFNAADREEDWRKFVAQVPSCAGVASSGNTFPCLQAASEAEIKSSFLEAGLSGDSTFLPTIDTSRSSIFPDFATRLYKRGAFARVPFIAGTNLDEGTGLAAPFSSPNATNAMLLASIIGLSYPHNVPTSEVTKLANELMALYPDDPALGSPFGTGDELFGRPAVYKRAAAIHGDVRYQAPRRHWNDVAAAHRLKSYAYYFTQPQLGDPANGVAHATEIPFVYGYPRDPSPAAKELSITMMDYWISFADSLDPNDRRGSKRPYWPQYSRKSKLSMKFEGGKTGVFKDDFRDRQFDLINSNPRALRR